MLKTIKLPGFWSVEVKTQIHLLSLHPPAHSPVQFDEGMVRNSMKKPKTSVHTADCDGFQPHAGLAFSTPLDQGARDGSLGLGTAKRGASHVTWAADSSDRLDMLTTPAVPKITRCWKQCPGQIHFTRRSNPASGLEEILLGYGQATLQLAESTASIG